jgi:hypothetical protein
MSRTQKIVSTALLALVIAVSLLTIFQTQAALARPADCDHLKEYKEWCGHWCFPPWQGKWNQKWVWECDDGGTWTEHHQDPCGSC